LKHFIFVRLAKWKQLSSDKNSFLINDNQGVLFFLFLAELNLHKASKRFIYNCLKSGRENFELRSRAVSKSGWINEFSCQVPG
jgi:hypothetical protein